MIMPAFVLGNAFAAVLMRHTRSAMLQVLSSDYVRTARAKGLDERVVVLKHALRNALIPIITLGALGLGELLGGAVLTEQVFTIPGFGKLIVDAVFNRDYSVVQGVVLFTATVYITLNLLADLAYFLVNPRLRRLDPTEALPGLVQWNDPREEGRVVPPIAAAVFKIDLPPNEFKSITVHIAPDADDAPSRTCRHTRLRARAARPPCLGAGGDDRDPAEPERPVREHGPRHLRHDAKRDAYLESRGYRILRIWNGAVFANPGEVPMSLDQSRNRQLAVKVDALR